MKTVTVPKTWLNQVSLPGMGKSIELYDVAEVEVVEIRKAYLDQQLAVKFEGEDEMTYPVKNLWPDPHDKSRMTLFI